MDKTLAEIIEELTTQLLAELAQIAELEAAAVGGPAEDHAARSAKIWTEQAVRNAVERSSTRTKLAIQNAIVRMA